MEATRFLVSILSQSFVVQTLCVIGRNVRGYHLASNAQRGRPCLVPLVTPATLQSGWSPTDSPWRLKHSFGWEVPGSRPGSPTSWLGDGRQISKGGLHFLFIKMRLSTVLLLHLLLLSASKDYVKIKFRKGMWILHKLRRPRITSLLNVLLSILHSPYCFRIECASLKTGKRAFTGSWETWVLVLSLPVIDSGSWEKSFNFFVSLSPEVRILGSYDFLRHYYF